MEIIRIERAESTNTWVAQNETVLPSPSLVYCYEQSAGRGQRGNSWESAPGENITASLLFHPADYPANRQFTISEAIALAIADFLKDLGAEAKVKWPNDIYVGDRKICGILVENVVMERNLSRCIAGFGININQKKFYSDAPNPVSLSMITGKDYDVSLLMQKLSDNLETYLAKLAQPEMLHELFLKKLWRHDGEFYNFYDRVHNQRISAFIQSVDPDGILTLVTSEGESRKFAFKEVEYQ